LLSGVEKFLAWPGGWTHNLRSYSSQSFAYDLSAQCSNRQKLSSHIKVRLIGKKFWWDFFHHITKACFSTRDSKLFLFWFVLVKIFQLLLTVSYFCSWMQVAAITKFYFPCNLSHNFQLVSLEKFLSMTCWLWESVCFSKKYWGCFEYLSWRKKAHFFSCFFSWCGHSCRTKDYWFAMNNKVDRKKVCKWKDSWRWNKEWLVLFISIHT